MPTYRLLLAHDADEIVVFEVGGRPPAVTRYSVVLRHLDPAGNATAVRVYDNSHTPRRASHAQVRSTRAATAAAITTGVAAQPVLDAGRQRFAADEDEHPACLERLLPVRSRFRSREGQPAAAGRCLRLRRDGVRQASACYPGPAPSRFRMGAGRACPWGRARR